MLSLCFAVPNEDTNLTAVDLSISIHAPLAGCDLSTRLWVLIFRISIHASLAGCDSLCTNHGYNHNENDSEKGYANLTTTEKKMVLRGLRTFGTIDIASDSLSRGEPVFAEVPVQIRVLAMP